MNQVQTTIDLLRAKNLTVEVSHIQEFGGKSVLILVVDGLGMTIGRANEIAQGVVTISAAKTLAAIKVDSK